MTLLLEDKMMKYASQLNDVSDREFYIDDESDYTSLDEYFTYDYKARKYTEHGASKFVYIDHSCSTVLKVPFIGTVNYHDGYYDEDDEWVEYDDEDEPYYDDFCQAGIEACGGNWDYCADELYLYNLAKEQGLEMFFAETKFLTTLKKSSVPVYIQERAEMFGPGRSKRGSATEKSQKKAKEFNNDDKKAYINSDWLADAIDYYGEELVAKFLEWFKDYADDLHTGNLGYRIGEGPILIDFCGFFE